MKITRLLETGVTVFLLATSFAAVGQTWVAVPAPPLAPNITTVTPQQQLGGDYVALWDKCCSPESQPYAVPTNGDGSGHGYMTKNNVWGLDEGVSAESQDPTHSGRIYWFFGDTETAFPDSSQWGIFGLYGSFYPISSSTSPYPGCISNGTGGSFPTMYGLCLGNDSMAFTDSAQASKIPTCNFLGSVEWYANHTSPSYPSTSVPTGTLYNSCNLTQFINDSGTGAGVAPISAHVSPALSPDDSMLPGLTPNGAFTLVDPTYNDDHSNKEESIFLIYTVKATAASRELINYPTPTSSPEVFGTPTFLARSVLLKSSATGDIGATSPPTFSANINDSGSAGRTGTFSQLPTGLVTINTSGSTTTVTLCSGSTNDQFSTAWNSPNWQIVITAPALGQGWVYFYNSVPTTFGVNPNGYAYEGAYYPSGNALPNTGTMTVVSSTQVTLVAGTGAGVPPNSSTCTLGTAYWYAAVPVEGQAGPGKFMHVSAEVMATSTMPTYIKKNLPSKWTANNYANLPANVVFFFGASSHYRASNLYLAVMDYVDVLNDSLTHSMGGVNQNGDPTTVYVNTGGASGQGVNNAFYMGSFTPSSNPVDNPDGDTVVWTAGDETKAVPLFTDWTNQGTQPRTLSGETSALPCIGEQSVRYQPNLLDNSSQVEPNRPLFLLTYGSWDCGGLYARSSIVPWGQWSGEFQFLANYPVNLNPAFNGDNSAIAATVPGSEPVGCVTSTGQDCYNPNFTFWYPQLVYEPGIDTLAQTDGFLPNASSTNADESFNTNYPNNISSNILYCLNGGYWGYPPSYWGCNNNGTANDGSGTPNAIKASPFIDPTTSSPFLGNPYGAYQYPASTTTLSSGGTATVFMNISTFNPYKVYQSSVTFTAEAPPAAGSQQLTPQ